MLSRRRWALLFVVFSAVLGVGSLAWAANGHGGGGHGHGGGGGHAHSGGSSHSGGHSHSGGSFHSGGHSFSGGHGSFNGGHSGFSGGHSYVSHGNFGGHNGSSNHWGNNVHYYAGHSGYHNYGWPYSYNYYRYNNYRPYGYGYYPFLYGFLGLYNYGYAGNYYGYPSYNYSYPSYDYSYPSDYYVNGDDNYYADALPPREYVASRPVYDVAQVQFRLPDPQATIWVQGREINSSGTVRQFRSPQLNPAQQYTYAVKAQWNDHGKLVTDERRVKVQANGLAVVDFTKPNEPGVGGLPMPDLPPPQPRASE